jgi:Flp pilus assembly protein TadB
MIKPDAQQPDTNLPHLKSNTLEEGSEPVEEADQRLQDKRMQRLLLHERIRSLILSIGILAIIVSAVVLMFTSSIVPLFGTIVVVSLFYWCVDVYLNKSEAST